MSNMKQATAGKPKAKTSKAKSTKKATTSKTAVTSKTPVTSRSRKPREAPTENREADEVQQLTNGTDSKKHKASPEPRERKRKLPAKKVAPGTESTAIQAPEDGKKPDSESAGDTGKTTVKRTADDADASVPAKKPKTVRKTKSAVARKTTAKKQKVLLEVPKLPTVSGVLFVVGENDCGQLGLGQEIVAKKRPFQLDFPFQIVDIAAGGMHSVFVTDRGEVYSFGCNDEGALGRVTEDEEGSEYVPGRVAISGVVVKVSAGDSHSAALTEEGHVYIWGNFRSQEGSIGLTAPNVKSVTPIQIMKGTKVVSIASGNDHLACLSEEGVIYTCGCGEAGQLGRVSERSCKGDGRKGLASLLQPDVVQVKAGKSTVSVESVWSGSYSTFVKAQSTGAIFAFGLNNYNQLGFEGELMSFRPKCIKSFSPELQWKQISGSQHHTLALDGNGKVYSLGNKIYGRLGLGENCEDATEPTAVPVLQDEECIDISTGNTCSFSVSRTGKAYSWGMGSYQLGHGNEDDCHIPELIKGALFESWNVFRIAGGGQHTLILADKRPAS